jgi:hypothetical protein
MTHGGMRMWRRWIREKGREMRIIYERLEWVER